MNRRAPGIQWLRRRTVAVFGLIVFGYLAFGSAKLVYENYRVNQDTKQLNADYEQLQQHNLELKSLVAYYRTESYKDKQARQRLNFQKPGERLVVVPAAAEEPSTLTQPGVDTLPPTPTSNPKQWWEYFFKSKDA